MIEDPKNLTEQFLNLVERIATEMKVLLNTVLTKLDKTEAADTYATKTELTSGLGSKANTSHTHRISEVTDLQTTLDSKATTASVTSLTKRISSVESVTGSLSGNYAAKVHTHTVSDVTDLQTALDGKQPVGDYRLKSEKLNWNELVDLGEVNVK